MCSCPCSLRASMGHLRLFQPSFKRLLSLSSGKFMNRVDDAVSLPEDITDALDTSEMKHRRHPGTRRRAQVFLPEKLLSAAITVLSSRDMRQLREGARLLCNQLWSRQLPVETNEIRTKAYDLERQLLGERKYSGQQHLECLVCVAQEVKQLATWYRMLLAREDKCKVFLFYLFLHSCLIIASFYELAAAGIVEVMTCLVE